MYIFVHFYFPFFVHSYFIINNDIQKSKNILLRAEKLGNIEDIDAIYERLEDIYDKLGDKEKAKEYNKKWENAVL